MAITAERVELDLFVGACTAIAGIAHHFFLASVDCSRVSGRRTGIAMVSALLPLATPNRARQTGTSSANTSAASGKSIGTTSTGRRSIKSTLAIGIRSEKRREGKEDGRKERIRRWQ